MTNLFQVLARVEVKCIGDALPLYESLSGTTEVHRFAFDEVSLAWIGSFLLGGPPEVLTAARRVATLLVRAIDEAVASVLESGGAILEGPGDAPNRPRVIVRHFDGAVFEYIQPTRR